MYIYGWGIDYWKDRLKETCNQRNGGIDLCDQVKRIDLNIEIVIYAWAYEWFCYIDLNSINRKWKAESTSLLIPSKSAMSSLCNPEGR